MFLRPSWSAKQLDKIQMGDSYTMSDLCQYMLFKMATAGTKGQFCTPRNIFKMKVDMTEPNKTMHLRPQWWCRQSHGGGWGVSA